MIEGLQDKVVIITGGAHGIGKAYCLGFGKAHSQVVVADIDKPAADSVAAQITRESRTESLPVHVDVANEKSALAMAAAVLERFRRIDVLINNAAIFATIPMNRGRIETIDPEEWDRLMAVNLKGLFFCCRAVLPAMRAQKSGKIINIASGTVYNGSPGRVHYVTSKAGTIGFTRTLAREVGDHVLGDPAAEAGVQDQHAIAVEFGHHFHPRFGNQVSRILLQDSAFDYRHVWNRFSQPF